MAAESEARSREQDSAAVPWGALDGVVAVVLAFLVQIVGLIGLSSLVPSKDARGLWFSIAGYQFLALGVFLASSVLIFARYHVSPRALGFRFPGIGPLVLSALSSIPILLGANFLFEFFQNFIPAYHIHGNAQELLQGGSSRISLPTFIAIAAFAAVEAPLVEETLFRGILFQGARQSLDRYMPHGAAVFVAAVGSGIVFGFLHFQPNTLPILAYLGFALAYVFQLSRSTFCSTTVHAIVNFLAVLETYHIAR